MSTSDAATDSFAHITDLHFWEIVANPLLLMNKRIVGAANVALRRRREFKMDHTESFSDAVAETGVKTVLITGDFTSTSTPHEFELGADFARGLEKRGLQPIAIPGNHDVYTFESVRKQRFQRHLGAWMPGELLPAVKTLPGGTPVLFIPTVCPNLISSKGRIADSEIEAALAALGPLESPIVVAGHYPLLPETYGYTMKGNRSLRNAEALRRALGESGKEILYLSGHVHRFSYVQDPSHSGLKHLTTGAFFRCAHETGSEGEFSIVGVEDARFSVSRNLYKGNWVKTMEAPREM